MAGPNKDYVVLKLDHLGAETIHKRLPSVYEIGINFANVDITKEPIPVVPTIHYQMGGIPTNLNGQVCVPVGDDPNVPVHGLYAVGECSCVSVHGANRLGTNSLLDLLVFGKAAGEHIIAQHRNTAFKPLPADAADFSLDRLNRLEAATSGEYPQHIANDIRSAMQQHAGVFRTQASMDEGVVKIAELRERVKGLYSKKRKSINELKEGDRIAVPNDPTNLARTFVFLEQFGLVKAKAGVDPLKVTERDIAENPKKLKFVPLEAALLPRALEDTEFSVINGNFALSSGLKLTDAVALEKTPDYYLLVAAVRSADKNTPWANDLAAAFKTPFFRDVLDKHFPGYARPASLR